MKSLSFALILSAACAGHAKLNVVTTTTTLASLVRDLGGQHVQATSLTKSTQDPHFVEAKPSYMVKIRNADLLVAVGLDLEVGWLGNIQRGAKNPKLLTGNVGFFAAGDHIEAIEIPPGKVDRSHGDVHPLGNPHFHLDPIKYINAASALAKKMGKLDAENNEFYLKRADELGVKLQSQLPLWQKRVNSSRIKSVITYHKSFNYFLERFGLVAVANIEPKAGIPPTAKHIIALMKMVKEKQVSCIVNESYFEATAGQRLQKETGAHLSVVPVEVQTNYFELIDTLISAIEACSKEAT